MAEEKKNKDEIAGRAKEAAGALLDDESLRTEGRLDQAAGVAKKKVGELVDRVREAISPDESEPDEKNED